MIERLSLGTFVFGGSFRVFENVRGEEIIVGIGGVVEEGRTLGMEFEGGLVFLKGIVYLLPGTG